MKEGGGNPVCCDCASVIMIISHIVSVDVKHHERIREDLVCCDGALCPVGVLDVLHCVLIDSPEALNMIKEKHIITIISLIDKHGRDPKVCVLRGCLSLLADLSWMWIIVVILAEHGDCEHLKKEEEVFKWTTSVGSSCTDAFVRMCSYSNACFAGIPCLY